MNLNTDPLPQLSDFIPVSINPTESLLAQENQPSQDQASPSNNSLQDVPAQQEYIPPAQEENKENNEQVSIVIDDSKQLLIDKIKAIEKRLESGRLAWYKLWLYIMLVFTFSCVGVLGFYYTLNIIKFGLSSWNLVPLVLTVGGSLWNIVQCSLELQALRERSVQKASKAFTLMKGFLVFYSTIMIFVFIFEMPSFAIILHIYNYYGYLILLLSLILVMLGITFNGATKVLGKLVKRNILLRELETLN